MSLLWRRLLLIATVYTLVMVMIGFAAGRASAHDGYEGWTPPNNPNTSCCNNADCRPTRAYLGDDGLWRAWNGYKWLIVPGRALLPADYAKDGRNHLCEKDEHIYCFTPALPKS